MYTANFARFKELTALEFDTPEEFLERARKLISAYDVSLPDDAPVAHVIVGFSGNGKTTFINMHKKDSDAVVSMDKVVRDLCIERHTNKILPEEILDRFELELSIASSTNKELWVDGLWLNILTRGALITSLHQLGYRVHVVNLLNPELVSKALECRINDEWNRSIKACPGTTEMYHSVRKKIMAFHESEEKRNLVTLQIKFDLFRLGADEYTAV